MIVLLAVVAVLGLGRTARAQAGDAEHGFAQRIDQERTAQGLAALAPATDLQDVARRHAQRMAERGQPYHNPELGSEVTGWSMVGENVGVGYQVDDIHAAFMASSQHRDAILSPDFTEVGVGVHVSGDGRLWVVQVFRRPAAAAQAPAPAAPAAPAPAPARPTPPAPTTTAPPAPTTTAPPPPPPAPAVPATVAPARTVEGGPTLAAHVEAASPVAAVVLPTPVDLVRQPPRPAFLAAFLVAAVIGAQGLALRRMGLV